VSSTVNSSVAALIVSHDGARWLPAVIEGLGEQRTPVDAVVAVDTTSRDDSTELLRQAFGPVVEAHGSTSFPDAVTLGLEHVGDCEWVWLLHDDSRPDPGALEALLAAAEANPDADILGPKLREWPSLRRLLELGVTISGTGRRETGLERGEFDQGQHDEIRTALAVNTAGMLVRRSVLEELGGFDPQLPIFGNDIDFGWRAAAAGHRTIVVPQAVVFHAEAAHRGVRRTPITGRHTHYQERRAALYTLLVNAPARWLPFQVVRLGLGTLIRMIGYLLVRQVGQSLDELAALVSLYSSPRELFGARRSRARRRSAEPHDVRHLLAPRWLPYRHGLDFLSDLAAAATMQASDVAERRRAAKVAESGTPARRAGSEDDEDELAEDSGFVVRFLTNPVAVVVTLFVIVALVGARDAFGAVSGGALSPPPGEAADWWRLHLDSWHAIGQGTPVPAPAYVLPLAVAAFALGGSPAAAVSALLVLAVPISLWGAWRLLRVVGHLVDAAGFPTWLVAWGALSYALVPVVSGAWGEGRLGVVAAAALLPWLAHAALGFADPEPDRRWRAAWRSALFIALGAAFAPIVFWVGVVLALVVIGVGFLISPEGMRDRSVWGPPAAAMAAVPVLLAPWWLPALVHGAGAGFVFDAGRLPMPEVGFQELLLGRLGDGGAPWWLGLVLPVLAALALIPRATRIPVLVCWMVALGTAVLAAALGLVVLDFPTITTGPGLGFLVVLLQAFFLVAAVTGMHGFLRALPAARWRRPAVATGAVLVSLVPALGLAWFAIGGHGQLGDDPDTGIPAYMIQNAMRGPEHGILVVRGEVSEGLDYSVLRDDGTTTGEDEIAALSAEDESLTRDVRSLVSGPSPGAAGDLAGHGVEYVVLPAPADGVVASALDATAGLTQASAEDRSTRAWQVERAVDQDAVAGPDSWLRVGLLVVQALAIVVIAVLAAPTTGRERR
jgi:GT2 family glycosyltransferase